MSQNIFKIANLTQFIDFNVSFFITIDVHKSQHKFYYKKKQESAANYVKSFYCVYFVVEFKFAVYSILSIHKYIRIHSHKYIRIHLRNGPIAMKFSDPTLNIKTQKKFPFFETLNFVLSTLTGPSFTCIQLPNISRKELTQETILITLKFLKPISTF